ncbi:hypothetical protein L1049_020279 [Liquidambar formosana]|uniref:F-box domain-containing protein n=1 Tax=Liquidambar formosana TaxID=63359 RepID=A0AAP0X3K8_LIQFO
MATKRIRAAATSVPSTAQQTSSAAADAIAGNDDLLTEILRLLPTRSLFKFKSVSKHWLKLISSQDFSRRLNPNPTVSALFLPKSPHPHGPVFDVVPLDGKPSTAFPNLLPSVFILQSCNGLLCSDRYPENKLNYYIYNPTTHQFTLLPELEADLFSTVACVILAFDPRKSPDYKVLCVRLAYPLLNNHRIEIYSSKARSWRVSCESFTATGGINFGKGVYWNGAIHWITNVRKKSVFSFDVDEERVIGETPMPVIRDWNRMSVRYFGECRGHLHLVLISGRQPWFIVYEMERDYSGWFVKYKVDLGAVSSLFSDIRPNNYEELSKLRYRDLSILCLVREEKDEESFLVMRTPEVVVRYRFQDKTLKKLCDFTVRHARPEAYQYIETLAQV